MISVIVYGRNDNHGYNYHKRVAISLNTISETLTESNDEIIFVDYNTKNDLPTLPEAIKDTLTNKTLAKLKIFRLRDIQHNEHAKTNSPKLLESFARNIGIRRSNVNNRWILSTNSDMIFVPKDNYKSLSYITSDLKDGYYTIPRYELPEKFWEENLNRLNPKYNIDFLRNNGETLHLNMVVKQKPYIGYDNVGDFQLILRKDLFEICGFNENMRSGWHIDANISKRLFLKYKKIHSLHKELLSYHCNHTLSATLLHSPNRIENSWKKFVEKITKPALKNNNWGLLDKDIEQISLSENLHLSTLNKILASHPKQEHKISITLKNFNNFNYSSLHTLPYLVDHINNYQKTVKLIYIGNNFILSNLLNQYLYSMKFSNTKLTGINLKNKELKNAEVLIFDFGFDDMQSDLNKKQQRIILKQIMRKFLKIVTKPNRKQKIIGINTSYTDFRIIFRSKIHAIETGHNSNISYGYTSPQIKEKRTNTAIKIKLSLKSMKEKIHFILVRYFFNLSDLLRKTLTKLKLDKIFFKSA